MFNNVLEKSNVVGVWYTYDQIILTGMDWLLCAFHNFSDHLFLIIREPGYWYQPPLSDYKKCQIAVCSSVAYGTHWDPQWQPDTTGVVITPLQQILIDNRGQPACRSLMGLGWGCPIDCLPDQNLPYCHAYFCKMSPLKGSTGEQCRSKVTKLRETVRTCTTQQAKRLVCISRMKKNHSASYSQKKMSEVCSRGSCHQTMVVD